MTTPSIAKPSDKKAALLWSLSKGHRKLYLYSGLAMVAGSLLSYGQPLIVGAALDYALSAQILSEETHTQKESRLSLLVVNLMGGPDFVRSNLYLAALAALGITVVSGVLIYLKSKYAAIASEGIAKDLRDKLFDHLQHLPCAYHDKAQTGDLVQRATSDVDTVRLFYSDQIVEVARAITLLLAAIPVLIYLDPILAMVAVSVLPLIVLFALIFFWKVQGVFKKLDEAEGQMTATLQENLTGVRVVRAFARQAFEEERFARANTLHRTLNWKLFKIMAVYWSVSDLLCFLQMALVLIVGAVRVESGAISVGTMVSCLFAAGLYIWPVRQMGRILTELGKAMVAAGRINEVFEQPRETTAAMDLPALQTGRLTFQNVSIRRGETDVLSDVSFELFPGKTVALLGPSGSGKSTVVQILLRLLDPDSGRVLLGETDIQTVSRKSVRANVAAVLQEPFLFSKTVNQNIKLGRHSATDQEAIEVAQAAVVHDSIVRFDKQYDTMVGERGVTLSGGQRQRLAIARALLREAPILVLDDALSAVDTHTEASIIEALRSRRDHNDGAQSTLLIAHRLSTLRHADEILVFDHGRIVQRGTHESLLAEPGMYKKLWSIQSELEEDLERETEHAGVSSAAELAVSP